MNIVLALLSIIVCYLFIRLCILGTLYLKQRYIYALSEVYSLLWIDVDVIGHCGIMRTVQILITFHNFCKIELIIYLLTFALSWKWTTYRNIIWLCERVWLFTVYRTQLVIACIHSKVISVINNYRKVSRTSSVRNSNECAPRISQWNLYDR